VSLTPERPDNGFDFFRPSLDQRILYVLRDRPGRYAKEIFIELQLLRKLFNH